MKSTLKAKLQHVYSKTHSMFALTLFVFFISWIPASQAACSIHDHICGFHVGDATVRAGAAASTGTSLVMYATATNPGTTTASTVDFDTLGKMPANTGDKFLVGSPINYTTPTGPYIVNSTAYGSTHPPTTWSTPGDAVLQVAPSQYQLTFNQNTAIAKHTGDFNGGENGNIPGATGCPNMPAGTKNCEAVVVTGNVPNGIYEQKVTLFNYFNAPNPQVQLQVGAYTTGRAVIISNSHESKEQAYFPILSGTGATTPAYQYEVYNLGFDPHAKGTALFDQNKYSTRYSNTYEAGDHRFRDAYFTTLTTHNKVNADGWNDKTYTAKTSVEKQYMGEVVRPPAVKNAQPSFFLGEANLSTWQQSLGLGTPDQTSQLNVPYRIGVNVAEANATSKRLLVQRETNLPPTKSALDLFQEGEWKKGGARFWDRLTDPEVAKASFSKSASDAAASFTAPYHTVDDWFARHNEDTRTQNAGFVLQEVGKGVVKDLTKMTVTLGQPINAGFSGIGAFAGTLIGDAWYSGSVNWTNAVENGGAAVNKYNQDRAALSSLLESKNTSQEAGKVIGLLATGFIPVKGISTPELTPSFYTKVVPELPKPLALPAPSPQVLIPERAASLSQSVKPISSVVQVGASGVEQIVIKGKELSFHAVRQMARRGVTIDMVENAMKTKPFAYIEEGASQLGYYDVSTNVFVGVGDRIRTVIIPSSGINYIKNLLTRK